MKDSLIKATSLSKSFHGQRVVESVSLSLKPGEIMTIIGPNGSGKTTLIKLLLGLETPDTGSVTRKEKLRVGYVPQKLQLSRVLPVTAEWFLRLSCHPGEGRDDTLKEITSELGIDNCLHKSVHTLSGGEMQRLLLARALLAQPELLVLDEPAQGVDVTGQAELYALIARVSRQRGSAVLMVSHDLHLVMSATDHVICLNHHICCEGHPHSVQDDPAFTELFGKRVANELAVYTHHHDHNH
ncbi:MAG: ATP-binding cassette domain-containing protein [Alphaproteobacteria bacterium]|nr:ATP-binding cassette domain-containing protein [Alphaproteobacteria bacterium]